MRPLKKRRCSLVYACSIADFVTEMHNRSARRRPIHFQNFWLSWCACHFESSKLNERVCVRSGLFDKNWNFSSQIYLIGFNLVFAVFPSYSSSRVHPKITFFFPSFKLQQQISFEIMLGTAKMESSEVSWWASNSNLIIFHFHHGFFPNFLIDIPLKINA